MKVLEKILQMTAVKKVVGDQGTKVYDVTADSREVKMGSLFFCLRGTRVDGHAFVRNAVEKGASVIVAEDPVDIPAGVTVVYVENVRKVMEETVPYFFEYPARKMRMIGVTGTNGKTTTTHIISHILKQKGYETGVIGTVHALIGNKEIPTHNTTPDVIDLQRILAQMVKENVTHVCMEVSSHALAMGRVEGCEFDTAVFTNLTEDHLDYHKTMNEYGKAKSLLFELVSGEGQTKKNKTAWINGDDSYASMMEEAVTNKDICPVYTYGMETGRDLLGREGDFTGKSSVFTISWKGKDYKVQTRLAGRFNMYNTMSAIGAALSEGISIEDIIQALGDFQSVPGRFELIDEGQSFSVVVDYAHTPDGLEKIIMAAQGITKGKVITVFGCGGDRDRMKRPIMGRIAAEYSDIVIVTSDNPRTENPESIVCEVEAGVEKIAKNKPNLLHEVVVDRRQAIQRAISLASGADIVLIAGKGHENYQILKDRTIHFDDREEARKALRG